MNKFFALILFSTACIPSERIFAQDHSNIDASFNMYMCLEVPTIDSIKKSFLPILDSKKDNPFFAFGIIHYKKPSPSEEAYATYAIWFIVQKDLVSHAAELKTKDFYYYTGFQGDSFIGKVHSPEEISTYHMITSTVKSISDKSITLSISGDAIDRSLEIIGVHDFLRVYSP